MVRRLAFVNLNIHFFQGFYFDKVITTLKNALIFPAHILNSLWRARTGTMEKENIIP